MSGPIRVDLQDDLIGVTLPKEIQISKICLCCITVTRLTFNLTKGQLNKNMIGAHKVTLWGVTLKNRSKVVQEVKFTLSFIPVTPLKI